MRIWLIICVFPLGLYGQNIDSSSCIRINQLGYTPSGIKIAVWCSKGSPGIRNWELVDASTGRIVLNGKPGHSFGAYGPFDETYRLDFSSYRTKGRYFLRAGRTRSPDFNIGDDVYKGSADFCLRYMRQQRSGFNPFLKDSCHTHDGYVLYGEKAGIPDSTYIDVSGGWHDASDYLQYSSTSANATYHLLMAYRDFPKIFSDEKLGNGLDGKNNLPDVLDEAKWGIKWLIKMFPQRNVMFNQLGDDRDHQGMRIPKEDSFYGKGYERPVYLITGEPQRRGKFMNNTTGTSSTAAKFSSVFALCQTLYQTDSLFRKAELKQGYMDYYKKAMDAFDYAMKKPGVTQTVSVRSPYIYAEDNWTDDMELASANLHDMLNKTPGSSDNGWYLVKAVDYAKKEKYTPWLGADTAKHYQWYPFINLGHYELIKELHTKVHGPVPQAGYYQQFVDKFWNNEDTITGYYKLGIQNVWDKARQNAFYRGIPFIWCSNNLTTSFAIQCYWYRKFSGDNSFSELEQSNIDWLFGCNPWGTSMVYGLPAWGDSPVDPHSAFTHLKGYPIDGGLVDGPVYTSIYQNLIGIKLYQPDEYERFQSGLAVYHDDYGDYSTNEPTMDGTASLIYLLAAKEAEAFKQVAPLNLPAGRQVPPQRGTYEKFAPLNPPQGGTLQESSNSKISYSHGAIIRGDSSRKKIAILFTGDEYAEGGNEIAKTLETEKVKASFFFTGRFYRNPTFKTIISKLKKDGHYLGAHSDKHLLYCDWTKRDSLLVNKEQFQKDLLQNYSEMNRVGIKKEKARYFLPPYEWFNDTIAAWTKNLGLQLICLTPGTLSPADYTTIADKNYRNSETIFHSILDYEQAKPAGLNGFILLMHIGAGPGRTDKFYKRLPELIQWLRKKGYHFQTVESLLQ